MRTIKFRAQEKYLRHEKQQKEMFCGSLIVGKNKVWILTEETQEDLSIRTIEVDKETVGQFTGLLDKNGKEIFEGDIVEMNFEVNTEIGEIKWNEKSARWVWISTKDNNKEGFGMTLVDESMRSVIGKNIK